MVYRRRYAIRTSAPLAAPLRAADRDGYTALWLGPDEFLLFSAEKPYIPADSIVDVSDRTVSITVDGPHAALCINAFCALDLDGFPVGACTRTLFGKAEIILWRRDEAWFHIETARSFHPYVEACLAEAEREFRPRG